jgi:Tfp pilus assembly protein PilF
MRRIALSLLLPLSLFLAGCPPKPAPKPAVKALSAADKKKVEAHYIAGVYAHAEGDTAKAMASWRKALALDPRHGPTRKAMAEARAEAEALKKLER